MFARRGARLTPHQAANAWFSLSEALEEMGKMDIPKFADLLIAFRVATVRGINLSKNLKYRPVLSNDRPNEKGSVPTGAQLQGCDVHASSQSPLPGQEQGLAHALTLVRGRRVLNRVPAYLAAIDELEIFLEAALERVRNGESMNATNVTVTTPDPVCPKCGGRQGFPNSATHHGAIRPCWCDK